MGVAKREALVGMGRAGGEGSAEKADGRGDRLNVARRRAGRALRGFSNVAPNGIRLEDLRPTRFAPRYFPVPELVLFLMRNLMGWDWAGPAEKVRWTVFGSIEGEPLAFELRKSGFTMLRAADAAIPGRRIVGQLHDALREVEDLLAPFAAEQVDVGEVLIVNRFGEFDGRYRFFRTLADEAYARARRPHAAEHDRAEGRLPDIAAHFNASMRANREGFFHSTAMVDGYFSALEHRLVLLRAFTGLPLPRGALTELLARDWSGKLKLVLDGLDTSGGLLGRMRRIKERIRNPSAHGGVENDKGSLFFHLPHIGAVPANFSRFRDSVRFSLLPIEAADHAQVCATFDDLDRLLTTGPLAGPNRLLTEGIDPSFDAQTLASYAEAVAGGEEAIDDFVDRWGEHWMRHANMDY